VPGGGRRTGVPGGKPGGKPGGTGGQNPGEVRQKCWLNHPKILVELWKMLGFTLKNGGGFTIEKWWV